MVVACMIDGFGWFRNADYRRAWLLFDDVHYIFPGECKGPLVYLPRVFERPEYRAAATVLSESVEQIDRWLTRDLADRELRDLVGQVPAADATYARRVVETDPELEPLLARADAEDPVAPVSILASKLLLYSVRSGALPIVGRPYASGILQRKLRIANEETGVSSAALLSTPTRQLAFTAFGAGLSMSFISDEELGAVEFKRLIEFKRGQGDLLARHRQALLEVSERFSGELGSEEFEHALRLLRLDALRQRRELDAELDDAWFSSGLSLLKKSLSVERASLAAVPALVASLPNVSIGQLAIACAPAAAALVSEALDLLDARRKVLRGDMTYLFQAERLLETPTEG